MPSPPEEREPRGPSLPPDSTEEALRRLEQRLGRATEAAKRLMAQAAAEAAGAGSAAGGAGNPGDSTGDPPTNPGRGAEDPGDPTGGAKPPPAGWQIPEDVHSGTSPELDPFVTLLQAMRDLIPPELQRRLVAALRELLLALRALIDWYLERLERRREQSVEVEDIPIL